MTYLKKGLLIISLLLFACDPQEITSIKMYESQKNDAKVMEAAKTAVEKLPNNAEAHFWLGHAYGKKKEFVSMNREFDQALTLTGLESGKVTQIHQEKEMYWVDSYNLAVASNKIAGAYSDSIKLMPTKENASLFGEKQQKAYATAENTLKDAIAIDPSRFDAYNFLTSIYDFQGKFDQSSLIWKEADQAMHNNLNAKFGLVKSYQNQKKFPEAISVLQSIRKLKPDSSEVYNLLARTYYTMGDSANFLSMLNEMVTKFPNDKQNFKFLGQIYYQKKDYKTATEKFSRAVEIDPKDYDATYNLALMQAAVGQDLGEKIQSIERQLLKNPKNPKKLEQDVTDLNNKRKAAYNASIVALRRAIEIDPKSFDAYDLLFRCYANLGNKAEAESALKKRDELKSR